MACFSGMIHSNVLKREVHLSAVLPQDGESALAAPKKTLLLLHGLGDTNEAWLSKSLALRLAEKSGVAVLMPDYGCSFACDTFAGERWFAFLSEELPQIAMRMFLLSPEPQDWLVAGQSMGGYAALRIALQSPQQYGAAGLFSPAWDLQKILFDEDCAPIERETARRLRLSIFGAASVLPAEADIRQLLKKQERTLPLYVSMGREDPLRESGCTLLELLREGGYPCLYEEFAGGHEWPAWHPALEHFLLRSMGKQVDMPLCAARELLLQESF